MQISKNLTYVNGRRHAKITSVGPKRVYARVRNGNKGRYPFTVTIFPRDVFEESYKPRNT